VKITATLLLAGLATLAGTLRPASASAQAPAASAHPVVIDLRY